MASPTAMMPDLPEKTFFIPTLLGDVFPLPRRGPGRTNPFYNVGTVEEMHGENQYI